MPASVLIVEDHPLVRLGLSYSLDQHPGLEKCGEAETEVEALQLTKRLAPDVIIVDLTLSSGSGLDLIKRLRQRGSDVAIVVSSMHDREVYEQRSLLAGATAYVPKDCGVEHLMRTVVQAISGRASSVPFADAAKPLGDETTQALTDRELQIFRLIGQGHSTRQVAESLHRSVKTIEAFRAKLKKKLGLASSEALVRDAVRWVYEHDAA